MLDEYQDHLDFLYGRLNYEWVGMPRIPTELRLGRMRRLLKGLGDPHLGLRVIHIAGTKGKGSTAALMAAALTASGWKLTDILVTHHHGDHTAGIAELKRRHHCRVVAPRREAAKIPDVDATVGEGDTVTLGALTAQVIETPGHTLGQINYFFPTAKLLFAGDTLFSIGCGRVIEGTPEMMWASLLKLRALPDDTQIYCGHEYTQANIRFALTIEPDNPDLRARAEEAKRQIAAGQATIPTTMGAEKRENVFLRADEPSVAAGVRMKGRSAAEVFGELRERKNKS